MSYLLEQNVVIIPVPSIVYLNTYFRMYSIHKLFYNNIPNV